MQKIKIMLEKRIWLKKALKRIMVIIWHLGPKEIDTNHQVTAWGLLSPQSQNLIGYGGNSNSKDKQSMAGQNGLQLLFSKQGLYLFYLSHPKFAKEQDWYSLSRGRIWKVVDHPKPTPSSFIRIISTILGTWKSKDKKGWWFNQLIRGLRLEVSYQGGRWKAEREVVDVSHLLFANDILVFYEPSLDQLTYLSWVLMWFEAMSRLKVNLDKS